VITYTCDSGEKMYAKCESDGKWSPTTISECGATTAAPSPPAATTATPCKFKYKKNKKMSGRPIKRIKRVKNVKICWTKCLGEGGTCNAVVWMKKKKLCFLLAAKGKLKKKKGFFSGWC
jgi:hypothetical protein